jgi:hypothetical protein
LSSFQKGIVIRAGFNLNYKLNRRVNKMRTSILIFVLISFILTSLYYSQNIYGENPLAHTYSIVAYDSESGEMGVAVQSHWFSVGSLVAWGEAGVGVVATQSFVNVSYGIRGLELLKLGLTPLVNIIPCRQIL